MKALRFPPPDDPRPDRGADAFLDDLDRLAAEAREPEEFYRRLLGATADAVGALVAERWDAAGPSVRRAERFRTAGVGIASAPSAAAGRVESVAREATPRQWRAEPGDAVGWWIACPVRPVRETEAVLALGLPEGVDADEASRTLEFLHAVAEIAERRELAWRRDEVEQAARRAVRVESLALRLQAARGVAPAARLVAEATRAEAAADRVAVLVRRGGRWRVAAVSGAPRHAARSDAVRRIERLAAATILGDQGAATAPAAVVAALGSEADRGPTEETPPPIADALDRYRDAAGAKAVLIAPCVAPDTTGAPRVALLAEAFDGALADGAPARLAPLARHADAALRRAVAARPLAGIAPTGGGWATAFVAAACVAGLIAALWLVPAELTVRAEGRFVPVDRARVFAPMDGVVEELLVGHGDAVEEGQRVARLRSADLEIASEEIAESIAITERELASLETAKLRGRLSGSDQEFDASAVAARAAALTEQLEHQRRRQELLRAESGRLDVASPLAGRVVSWRPEDYLTDRPVRRGDRLLEIASTDGDWRIELDLPDRETGPVLDAGGDGLAVRYVVKAAPETEHAGRVVRVATATRVDPEGRPVLRLDVDPGDLGGVAPRSGLVVVAKIDCGQQRLGYVWFHEAWKAVLRRWF